MLQVGKKITIHRRATGTEVHSQKSESVLSGLDDNVQETIQKLELGVRKLRNRFQQYGYNDSREQDFFSENKGKMIVVELTSRHIEGTLELIDKYRVAIQTGDTLMFIYKHAIVGYHLK